MCGGCDVLGKRRWVRWVTTLLWRVCLSTIHECSNTSSNFSRKSPTHRSTRFERRLSCRWLVQRSFASRSFDTSVIWFVVQCSVAARLQQKLHDCGRVHGASVSHARRCASLPHQRITSYCIMTYSAVLRLEPNLGTVDLSCLCSKSRGLAETKLCDI